MMVETPMRLHFGLIDPSGALGRKYGGLGLSLEGGYIIKIIEADSLQIRAHREDLRTIKDTLKKLNSLYSTGTSFFIEVKREIPRHVGLGSTTQLTLAVSKAVLKIKGLDIPVERVATLLDRGKVSGIGVHVFRWGGFVVDGGKGKGLPPLVVRHDFPKDWAFVLVLPDGRRVPEEGEEELMASIVGRTDVAMEVAYRILLGLLPALKERNIEAFGQNLSAIQKLVGKHFEELQGGVFREDVRNIVEFLCSVTYGCGQSSWGPLVYGLIKRESYTTIASQVKTFLEESGIKADVFLGVPRNRGAEIVVENAFLRRILSEVNKNSEKNKLFNYK